MKKLPLDNCPFCGGRLEKGIVYTRNSPGLIFLSKLTAKEYEKAMSKQLFGGIIRKYKDCIVLDGPYMTVGHSTMVLGYACRSCEMVICRYESGPREE